MSTTVPGHSTGRLSYLERVFHVQERGSSLRTLSSVAWAMICVFQRLVFSAMSVCFALSRCVFASG